MPAHGKWLHRYAVLVAAATFCVVIAGASVTSTGSGLAVPDWPLSYGTLFPPMVGGILFEHGHRMIAGAVVLLVVVLNVWLSRVENRRWVRRLGQVALAGLFVQATLGGLTVLFKLPAPISVSHAALAVAIFGALASVALFTSPGWIRGPEAVVTPHAGSLRTLAFATTAVIYIQILVGAVVRHTGAGLAIPDFPLVFGQIFPQTFTVAIAVHYAHRVWAGVVILTSAFLVIQIVRHHWTDMRFKRPAVFLAAVAAAQVMLGGLTIWTQRAAVVTTAHAALGAAILTISLVLTLRCFRFLRVPATLPRREVSTPLFSGSRGEISGGGEIC